MTRNDFCAAYPNGRVIEPTSSPFNLYYVIDGVDERGRVWPGINAVCRLAARSLYLQMGSQVGRKGENDFDNLDEVLSGTDDHAGTFLGSVGLSVCQFNAAVAHDLCARRQAVRLIREGWLRPENSKLSGKTILASSIQQRMPSSFRVFSSSILKKAFRRNSTFLQIRHSSMRLFIFIQRIWPTFLLRENPCMAKISIGLWNRHPKKSQSV